MNLEWFTFCIMRRWALRLLGIILGLISLIVIWSEMTFFRAKNPVLSIFALCVNAARDHHRYFIIEVNRHSFSLTVYSHFSFFKAICCLSIAYLSLCAYYTIFRIRVFNYFYLSIYHQTDETSLIFAATFLCRLTASLSYNFLGMIHMDQAITNMTNRSETAFTSVREIRCLNIE